MRPALIPLRRVRTGALAAALLALGGCVSIPTGPSVATFPGTGRSFDQFRADEADCRRHASDSIGGSDPSRAQASSAVTSGGASSQSVGFPFAIGRGRGFDAIFQANRG